MASVAELQERVGEELGVSDWMTVDQQRIDAFADATLDHQFIHIDPERAAHTPWGTTIAHGFLTLSLVPHLTAGIVPAPDGTVMAINYGTDKVRFIAPVKSGSKVRARVKLAGVQKRSPGQWLVKSDVAVEIDGEDKPALAAEALTIFVVQ